MLPLGTLPARTGVFPAQSLECGGYRRFDFTCPAFSPKRRGAPHSKKHLGECFLFGICGLDAYDSDIHLAVMRRAAMFEDENTLPGAQSHPSANNGNHLACPGKCHS
jgi:hypothetical protein